MSDRESGQVGGSAIELLRPIAPEPVSPGSEETSPYGLSAVGKPHWKDSAIERARLAGRSLVARLSSPVTWIVVLAIMVTGAAGALAATSLLPRLHAFTAGLINDAPQPETATPAPAPPAWAPSLLPPPAAAPNQPAPSSPQPSATTTTSQATPPPATAPSSLAGVSSPPYPSAPSSGPATSPTTTSTTSTTTTTTSSTTTTTTTPP